jgi:hypothetical protein
MAIQVLKFYILNPDGNYHDAVARFYSVSEGALHIRIFNFHSHNVSALLSLKSK